MKKIVLGLIIGFTSISVHPTNIPQEGALTNKQRSDNAKEKTGSKGSRSSNLDRNQERSNTPQPENFQTQIPKGNYRVTMGDILLNKPEVEEYCFTIVADPHLDSNTDTTLLKKVMESIARQNAAFTIDLGDTFMVEKYGKEGYKDSEKQFEAIKYYYSLTHTPLYLVMGNHDASYRLKTPEMYRWAASMREKHLQAPTRTFYSFTYGNTLFVILDPYLNTPPSGSRNPEDRTLGKDQLEWLEQVLSASSSKHKLIFTHTLVGGADLKGKDRGGAEVAGSYEWGKMIEPLLRKYHVTAVFHGHDHLFAHQSYEGITYQCVPQPAPRARKSSNGEKEQEQVRQIAAEYGYLSGTILSGGGYLKLQVSDSIRVELISDNRVRYSYTLP